MTPTRWIALTVRVPSEELTEELAGGLVALGGLAVEQDVDLLTTYIPEPEDPDAFLAGAADRLTRIAATAASGSAGPSGSTDPAQPSGAAGTPGGAAGTPELELLWRWQDDEDWSARWKEGLGPRRVGERIVVTQPWNPVEPVGDEVVLVIEPSSAFGTGEHATTRGVLRLLERTVRPGDRVLDVGTGSAILAVAAIELGADSVLAVESDEGAIATAAANLARAGVDDRVELVNAAVDPAYLETARGDGFDLIVANVLSGVLAPLLAGFRQSVEPGGRVILGGIMAPEVDAIRRAARAAGLEAMEEDREGEWWTGLLGPAR